MLSSSSRTTRTPFMYGEQSLTTLGECLERDLQGLHAATTTSLCEVEAMFGELVSMMAQSPRTSIALHWPDGKANANQRSLPTDASTTVAVNDKATCTSSNQLETKATQTSEPQVACVSTVDLTHINLQISLEQCLSRQLRRNKLSALGERMKLRCVVLTWRKVQLSRMQWADRAAAACAAVACPTEEDTWMHEIRERDGKYGMAKAVHARRTCRRVLIAWFRILAGRKAEGFC
ncbi:hypothetical protein B5M09_002981 [Aphanomyces astaci]|uniref:Uncharacterized protein n=1 Tax=Aphanomyces astaci TaxID=112090 RepID=A0A425D5A0_APHAT|nr:hypothetical protein B5M09_002981 [Aphanomyces astaci]